MRLAKLADYYEKSTGFCGGFLKEQNRIERFGLHKKIKHDQTLTEGPSVDGQKTANEAIWSLKRSIRSSELSRDERTGGKGEAGHSVID